MAQSLNNEQEALNSLRNDIEEMMENVLSQLSRAREALSTCDKDLAEEILSFEKHINSMDVRINKSCENILALYNPLAINLRYTLAVLNISSQLERIADHAADIAEYINEELISEPFDEDLMKKVQFNPMFPDFN